MTTPITIASDGLTSKQVRLAREVADEWVEAAKSTTPANRTTAEDAALGIYRECGLVTPGVTWVGSPRAAYRKIKARPRLGEAEATGLDLESRWFRIEWQIKAALGQAVVSIQPDGTTLVTEMDAPDPAGKAAISAVSDLVDRPVAMAFETYAFEPVAAAFRSFEKPKPRPPCQSCVIAARERRPCPVCRWSHLGAQREVPVIDKVFESSPAMIAEQDFWLRAGAIDDPSDAELVRAHSLIHRSCGWWKFYQDEAILMERPREIRRGSRRPVNVRARRTFTYRTGWKIETA